MSVSHAGTIWSRECKFVAGKHDANFENIFSNNLLRVKTFFKNGTWIKNGKYVSKFWKGHDYISLKNYIFVPKWQFSHFYSIIQKH